MRKESVLAFSGQHFNNKDIRTKFSHDAQTLLVVGPCSPDKDFDFAIDKSLLVLPQCPNNTLLIKQNKYSWVSHDGL